jgi:hypothetical protein
MQHLQPPHPALRHLPTLISPHALLEPAHCFFTARGVPRPTLENDSLSGQRGNISRLCPHILNILQCNHLARPSVSPSDAVSKICAPLGFHGEQFVTDVSGHPIGPLEVVPIRSPETSISDYQSTLSNDPEEGSSHLLPAEAWSNEVCEVG